MKSFLSKKLTLFLALLIVSKLCFCKEAPVALETETVQIQETEIKAPVAEVEAPATPTAITTEKVVETIEQKQPVKIIEETSTEQILIKPEVTSIPIQTEEFTTEETRITQIPAQLQGVRAKLTILNAEYGILDNKIRSGENVVFKNKKTECFLEADEDLWVYTKNKLKDFNEKYIFQIEKLDGKPGEIIKSGDKVIFKCMTPFGDATYYLGVGEKTSPWGMGSAAKKWYFTNLVTKKTDEAAHWIIGGRVTEGGNVTLKSVVNEKLVYDTKHSEKKAVVAGDPKEVDDRERFRIHRVLPPTKGNISLNFVTLRSNKIKNTDIIPYLNGLINSPNQIITNLNGGITIEDDFSDSFGDLGLSHPNTNIYKQLKVEYELDRRTYTHMYTDGEIIQIPTLEELIKAKQDVANRNTIKKDLEEIGFFPVKGRLVKISSDAGLTLGLNADNDLLIWNEKTQSFEPIKTELATPPLPPALKDNKVIQATIKLPKIKLKDIAGGNDGTIIAISNNNQVFQVQLTNGAAILHQLLPSKFVDVSVENKNNIWLIDPKGNVFKTTLEAKQAQQVGTRIFAQLSADVNEAWGLTADGTLYRWMGGENYQDDKGWVKISEQKFKQISIGKDVWAIGEYKTFRWNKDNNRFEEIGVARHMGYITTSNTGEVWILVPEKPNLPMGDAVYRKAKLLLTLNHPIALQGSNDEYLTVGPEGFVSAATSWPESFTFVNPANPESPEIFKYQQEIVIKSLVNDLYIKAVQDDAGNIFITATETDPQNATNFKIINQLNPEDSNEIEKGKQAQIFLETTDGLQLGTKRLDGSLYLDQNRGGFDKKWQIQDAAE